MNIIDLFAGCGGMSLGFQNEGFTIKKAYDNWRPAIETYRSNFNHEIIDCDLSKSESIIEDLNGIHIDVIIGGPPCQDFSHAGKRLEGHRANLTQSFAIIVSGIKPIWFVMENVDRVSKSVSYKKAKSILKLAGYGISEMILDASFCGVPQKRKRFFAIGKLNENDGFLDRLVEIMVSDSPMTLRDYFNNSLGIEYYYRHPRNYNRRAIFSIDEPAPTVRGVNRPIPTGYRGHKGDPVPLSNQLRSLTTLERAKIQTFPEDFIWFGTKTEVEQLIGNAVPVNLASFVARLILNYHQKKWIQIMNQQQLTLDFTNG